MINIIDIVIAALILFYLLRKAGGIAKTAINLLMVFVILLVFGIFARLIFDLPLPAPFRQTLENSYFVRLSHYSIKGIYPAVEKGAPQVDSFIKNKIIAAPTPEVSIPKVTLPDVKLPELPKIE